MSASFIYLALAALALLGILWSLATWGLFRIKHAILRWHYRRALAREKRKT